jgi:hypothetical protein
MWSICCDEFRKRASGSYSLPDHSSNRCETTFLRLRCRHRLTASCRCGPIYGPLHSNQGHLHHSSVFNLMRARLVIQDPLQVFQVDDGSFPCLRKCRRGFLYDEAVHPLYNWWTGGWRRSSICAGRNAVRRCCSTRDVRYSTANWANIPGGRLQNHRRCRPWRHEPQGSFRSRFNCNRQQ